ncbi:MAG: hypothetical protein ABIH39_03060 [Candidatus Margulisiibacteriota bacterium]
MINKIITIGNTTGDAASSSRNKWLHRLSTSPVNNNPPVVHYSGNSDISDVVGDIHINMSLEDLQSRKYGFSYEYKGKQVTGALLVDLPKNYHKGKKYSVVIIPPALGTRMTQFAPFAAGLKAADESIVVRSAFPESNDETSGDIEDLEITSKHLEAQINYILGMGEWAKHGGLQSEIGKDVLIDNQHIQFIAPSMSSMLVLETAEKYIDRIKGIVLLSPIPDLLTAILAKYPQGRKMTADIQKVMDLALKDSEIIKILTGNLTKLAKNQGNEGLLDNVADQIQARLSIIVANENPETDTYMGQKINYMRFFASVIDVKTILKRAIPLMTTGKSIRSKLFSLLIPYRVFESIKSTSIESMFRKNAQYIFPDNNIPLKYALAETLERLRVITNNGVPVTIIYPENDDMAEYEDIKKMGGVNTEMVNVEKVRGAGHEWHDMYRLKKAIYLAMRHVLRIVRDNNIMAKDQKSIPILSTAQMGMKSLVENIESAARITSAAAEKRADKHKLFNQQRFFQRTLRRMVKDEDIEKLVAELINNQGELTRFIELNSGSRTNEIISTISREFKSISGMRILDILGEERLISAVNKLVAKDMQTLEKIIREVKDNPEIILELVSGEFVWGVDMSLLRRIIATLKERAIHNQTIVFENIQPELLEEIGKRFAHETVQNILEKPVKPYIDTIKRAGMSPSAIISDIKTLGKKFRLDSLPLTDKENYFLALREQYSNPKEFAVQSEGQFITSGGSSGMPTVFAKSIADLKELKAAIRFSIGYHLRVGLSDKKTSYVINMMTQGGWVAGRRLNDALSDITGIQSYSPGPDIKTIINYFQSVTLDDGSDIIIIAYPGFAETISEIINEQFPALVNKHRWSCICGGDLLTEQQRACIANNLGIDLTASNKQEKKSNNGGVFTAYGSAETDISQAVDGDNLAVLRHLASKVDICTELIKHLSDTLKGRINDLSIGTISVFYPETALAEWTQEESQLFYNALNKPLQKLSALYDGFLLDDFSEKQITNIDLIEKFNKLLQAREGLKCQVFGGAGMLPAIFQYDPTRIFIENIEDEQQRSRIAITSNVPDTGAALIRYQMDLGSQVSYLDFYKKLNRTKYIGIMPKLKIPFLFINGRPDGISFGGENLDKSVFVDMILQNKILANTCSRDVKVEKAPEGSTSSCIVNICLKQDSNYDRELIPRLEEEIQTNIWQCFINDPDLKAFIVDQFGEAAKPIIKVFLYCEYPFHSKIKGSQ